MTIKNLKMRIVGKKTERKTNISLFPADIHTYKLTFVNSFSVFFAPFPNYLFSSGGEPPFFNMLTNIQILIVRSSFHKLFSPPRAQDTVRHSSASSEKHVFDPRRHFLKRAKQNIMLIESCQQ